MKTKTPKLKTTTEPYYDYQNFEFPKIEMENGIRDAGGPEMFMSYFGVLLTVFHFFILTKKELRTNFIFQCVLLIGIWDLLHFSGTLTWNLLEWYTSEKQFHGRVGLWHKILEICIITIEHVAKYFSATVMLVLPLANSYEVVKTLLWFILLIFFAFWTGLCTYFSYRYYGIEAVADEDYDAWTTTYTFERTISEEFRYFITFHEWTTVFLVVGFAVSFVIQFVRFRRLIRTRQEDNESLNLILLLTLSLLASEFLDLLVVLFSHFLLKPYCIMQEFFMQYQVIVRTLITLLSVCHPFICMLTSSRYWKLVKHYLSRSKNTNGGASGAATRTNNISNHPTSTNF